MGLPSRIPKDGVQPLLRFKVHIRRDSLKTSPYFWCSIWPSLAAARGRMRALGSEHEPDFFDTTYGACLCWQTISGVREDSSTHRMLPEMGEIVLAVGHVTDNIVAHECAHASFRYMKAVEEWNLPDHETPEERFCLTVGWMTSCILGKWYKNVPAT